MKREELVLPAHAGVIPQDQLDPPQSHSITRTCGGDPKLANRPVVTNMYYPHMRG